MTAGEQKGGPAEQPDRDKSAGNEKPAGFFASRAGMALVCALSLALVVGAALLWYPPLSSARYAPVSPSQPFFVQTAEDKVDINLATAAQLAVLPGIGEVKARAIVEFREENGPFEAPEDLLQVSGIGEKTLQGLLPYISL